MKREEKIAAFKEMASLTPEDRDTLIQTGYFNSYIEGYLSFTLEGLGYTPEDIERAKTQLRRELDTHTAKEARER